ncbi:MAG: tRNA (cytidine(34)-2'-O)-methyltransferase [Hyphococcus sp.]
MQLALYQPDIPQNVGAAIRVAACFGADLHIIAPCGFPLDSRKIARVAMDYDSLVEPILHESWTAFLARRAERRLILLTTKGDTGLWDFQFSSDDIILMGRESAGAPEDVHQTADARLRIPLAPGARALNVHVAAAIALAAASRQTGLESYV